MPFLFCFVVSVDGTLSPLHYLSEAELTSLAILRKHFTIVPEEMHNILPFLDAFDVVCLLSLHVGCFCRLTALYRSCPMLIRPYHSKRSISAALIHASTSFRLTQARVSRSTRSFSLSCASSRQHRSSRQSWHPYVRLTVTVSFG